MSFVLATKSVDWANLRIIIRSAIFLFITFACWSLASPVGSSPDEPFHIINIWCAEGRSDSRCLKTETNVGGNFGLTKIDESSCVLDRTDDFQLCDEARSLYFPMRTETYPNGYYRIMNVFNSLPNSLGFLAIRFSNGILASLMMIAQLYLLDRKQKIAWLTSFTLTLIPMSIFLLSSIHPHAWGIMGCTHGWMFLMSALKGNDSGRFKLYFSWAAWFVSGFMCIASRYDTFLFFLASSSLAVLATQVSLRRIVNRRFFWFGALLSVVSLIFVFRVPIVREVLRLPFDPSVNEYSNSTWFGSWVIRAIAIPIEILGSGVLGRNFVLMPPLVWILGSACIAAALAFAAVRVSRKQISIFAISLSLLFYVIIWLNDEMYRDLENMNGRYITALIPFILGLFVYLSDSPVQMMEVRNLRFIVIAFLSAANSISIRTLLDRSISGELGALDAFSILPIQLDQADWWWVGIPFGPNFIWALATISFFRFLTLVWSTIPSVQPTYNEFAR